MSVIYIYINVLYEASAVIDLAGAKLVKKAAK